VTFARFSLRSLRLCGKPGEGPAVTNKAHPLEDLTTRRLEDLKKTNAARILDSLSIPYEVREYEVDPDDLAAESVARKVGLPPEQVFKTLVVRGDRRGVVFAVIPGDQQLDLKALATLAGDKKIDTVPLKEVQPLTGYVRGGVTALAAKKDYPVFVDETIELFDVISISAGTRGAQLLLAPADYLRATKAVVGAIAKEK
jgi:Cys-tRNA(Pro)/Cys-tRNA(Cys) deacylase